MYWVLQALARRTKETDSIGDSGTSEEKTLHPWKTPVTYDATPGGPNNHYRGVAQEAMQNFVSWQTPNTRDHRDSENQRKVSVNPDGTVRLRLDQVPRQVFGEIIPSLVSKTVKNAVLNPSLPRWLMGFPQEWDVSSPNWQEWQNWQEEITKADSCATETP